MEEKIKLQTEDNKTIYGTLNANNNNALLIMVHGLTGHQNEHQLYNAKKFFPEKGVDTFRFDLYTWEENGRKLSECDIFTHSKDVDIVVNNFKEKYKQIFIVGHSLGGPSILFSKQEVDGVILWDPSIEIYLEEECKYIEEIGMYTTNWGIEALMSKEMIKSSKQTTPEVLQSKFTKPTLIIFGSEGILEERWRKTNIKNNDLVQEHIIQGAGHNFDENDTEIELFEKSLEFINNN